ncbi:PAS domain-containing sensor histidine kinase [Chengkuizengella sediminis]|uniref:PAS domain-containing sensor histidine kinase n=1 Tax=Chengkuizengella sediminis TaxID=1885917 RepID=UPI001389E079|nr:PAS domain-containing sensor histidine kinase [Chengkuizengella sediminis]NDI34523.1 PAS domain S-box protein [Chengkuizengella sediminis]
MLDKKAFLSKQDDVVQKFLTRADLSIYKQLFETSVHGLAIVSPSGSCIKINHKFLEILGYPEQNFHEPIESSFHIKDLQLNKQELEPLIYGKVDNYKVEKKLTSLLWISIDASIFLYEEFPFIFLSIENITSRKVNERKIKEELEFFKSFQIYNNLPIISCDLNGHIVFSNPAVGIKLGYRKEELLNQPLTNFMLQQNINDYIKKHKVILDGEIYTHVKNLDIICKNGETLTIEMKFLPIYVDDKLAGSHVIFWEANEYRNALNLIHHHNGLLFKYKKIDGEFVYTTFAGSIMKSKKLELKNLVGKTINDFFTGNELKRVEKYYRQAWEEGKVVSFEGIYLKNTYFLVTLKPVLEGGKTIEVVGTFTEITNLDHSRIRYQSLLNNSIVGIFLYQEGEFSFVNARLCEMYGYSQKELLEQNILDLFVIEERNVIQRNLQRLKDGFVNKIEMKCKGLHKNNTIINLKMQFSLMEFQDKPMIIGIINDVTETKLQKTAKQSIVSQLAAGFAHEIRNPLTTLKGFVRIMELKMKSKKCPETVKYINIMKSELERIHMITNKFLSLAKPQVVDLEKHNLHKIVQDVITSMEEDAGNHNIQINLKIETSLMNIRCDEKLLKKSFRHIIRNSIDAMPKGGEILVKIKSICNKLIVCVQDQGIGISSERLAKLGEPFYTTKEKGTGLGLMMCYKILEAHHGKIHISSRVNEGTTVEIYLPDMEGVYLN